MEKNKPITVFFEDGEKVNRKEGKFHLQDDKFLHIKIGNTIHSIPLRLIIRVESTGEEE